MSTYKASVVDVSTERKIFIAIGLLTVFIIVGGVWLISVTGQEEQKQLNKPLMGKAIPVEGASHINEGEFHKSYNSNPPTSGWMYDQVAGGGIHNNEVADELLVHSMEHGAVVVYYQEGLPKDQLAQVASAFNSASGKKILVPRKNLAAPVALTSWGRLLALKTIDTKTIKSFIETNENRGPEKSAVY